MVENIPSTIFIATESLESLIVSPDYDNTNESI
jgi:hypothetical protein